MSNAFYKFIGLLTVGANLGWIVTLIFLGDSTWLVLISATGAAFCAYLWGRGDGHASGIDFMRDLWKLP